jgi:transcriptional regulator with XRE-family HTH domain
MQLSIGPTLLTRREVNRLTQFGRWLNDARSARKLTTRELADLAGCSPAYVNKLELGRQALPKRDIVCRLAAALGRSGAEALQAAGYATESPDITPEAYEFDHILQGMDLDRRKTMMTAVRNLADLAHGR